MQPMPIMVRSSHAHPLITTDHAPGTPLGALHLIEPAPAPATPLFPKPLPARSAAVTPARDDGLGASFVEPELAVAAGREVLARMQEALGDERGQKLSELLFGPELCPRAAAPLPRATVIRLASGLLAGEKAATATCAELPGLWRGSLPIDVNALVQHVLREAYLQQTLELRDYAEKVKHHNSLRKLIRAQLQRTRELKAAWVKREQDLGSGNYRDPNGFACMMLNEDGEWVPMLTTADEAAATASAAAGLAAGSGAPADAGPQPPPAPEMLLGGLNGETAPLPEQSFLDVMLAEVKRVQAARGVATDLGDFADVRALLLANLDRLLAVVPLMNGEQMKKYLFPVFEHLVTMKVKQRKIMAIFGAMRPEQVLFAIANGWEEERLELEDRKRVNFIELSRNAATVIANSAGKNLADLETKYADKDSKKAIEITGPEARRILNAAQAENQRRTATYREAMQRYSAERAAWETEQAATVEQAGAGQASATPMGAGAPPAGEQRAAHTVEELEAYIQDLEEKLATVGEDAQLANVDLQNALQKQQQNLQLLSNISKLLHDTAMAIIRKIGQ